MNLTVRRRLMALLLPLSVGVAGAVGYAVSNHDAHKANQAADSPSTGTGTVGAKPSASPAPGEANGPKGEFFIAGTVAGLVPGSSGSVALTITNPNPWPIQVLTLNTGVGTPNGSPCRPTDLVVSDYTYSAGSPVVKAQARSTVQMSLPVTLVDSLTADQSGCRASTFPLTFTGTAEKVNK
jgi:hypothetical protein